MLHLSISARSLVDIELAHLYQRRMIVDQLIASLEQYAKATSKDPDSPPLSMDMEDKLAS